MKKVIKYFTFIISITFISSSALCAQSQTGFAPVNGLNMYYEIHGKSSNNNKPLVLIHGGGSTIETSFGKIIPILTRNRLIIAVELQGHGHTPDVDRPFTFEQDADDVAALLKYLKIESSDFFGFSNGGSTALQIGIRHPEIVNKLITLSAIYKRDGMYFWFWDFMKNASIDNMPQRLKDAYLKVAPNPDDLVSMHDKDANRMREFKDWADENIKSIKAPTLVIVSTEDVVRPEHAVEMFRLLPKAKLLILPGKHGECIGEITSAQENNKLPEITVSLVEEFLDESFEK